MPNVDRIASPIVPLSREQARELVGSDIHKAAVRLVLSPDCEQDLRTQLASSFSRQQIEVEIAFLKQIGMLDDDSTVQGPKPKPKPEPCPGGGHQGPTEPVLPKPDGEVLIGVFRDRRRPRGGDPVVLKLENIVAGAKLYCINVTTANPQPIPLPGDTSIHVQNDNTYQLLLSDDWMRDNQIDGGHVIRIVQEFRGEKSVSDPLCANPGEAPASTNTRDLGLSKVDNPFKIATRELFVRDPDSTPPRMWIAEAPNGQKGKLRCKYIPGSTFMLKLEELTEPYVKVYLENARTGRFSVTGIEKIPETSHDGSVEATLKDPQLEATDPIIIHLLDHSNAVTTLGAAGNRLTERRFTIAAGNARKKPVLAQNPEIGMERPPAIALRRVRVERGDPPKLVADEGVTAGNILKVNNVSDLEGDAVGVADASGSVSLPISSGEPGEYLDITVENPFRRLSTRIRAEVQADGSLRLMDEIVPYLQEHGVRDMRDLIDGIQRTAARDPEAPVPRALASDPLAGRVSLYPIDKPTGVTSLQVTNNFFLSVGMAFDTKPVQGRQDMIARADVDLEAKQITVTVGRERQGGWLEDGEATGSEQITSEVERNNQVQDQPYVHYWGLVQGQPYSLRLVDVEGNELGTAELVYKNNREGAVLNNVSLR